VTLSQTYNDCETKVLEKNDTVGQITQDRANNKISAAQADRKFKKAKASNQTQRFSRYNSYCRINGGANFDRGIERAAKKKLCALLFTPRRY
jgi:sulfatase maturation enzyme AslB (radical SAM superfamily)